MKPLIYNDVLAAVSVVAGVAPEARASLAADLIRQADLADAYRQAHCAAHPVFGDGSLMTAALRFGHRGPASFQCRRGLAAWIAVLSALQARHDPAACGVARDACGDQTAGGCRMQGHSIP